MRGKAYLNKLESYILSRELWNVWVMITLASPLYPDSHQSQHSSPPLPTHNFLAILCQHLPPFISLYLTLPSHLCPDPCSLQYSQILVTNPLLLLLSPTLSLLLTFPHSTATNMFYVFILDQALSFLHLFLPL